MDILKATFISNRKQAPRGSAFLDLLPGAIEELFFIRNPGYRAGTEEAQKPLAEFKKRMQKARGVFAYFPWSKTVLRIPEEKMFCEIKTARNRDVITGKEQINYRNLKVGIIGMSVGSNILWPLTATGGPKILKIADPDTIELSNLNRIQAPVSAVFQNKALYAARKLVEADPFSKVYCWQEGVVEKDLTRFLLKNPKLAVVVDEMDNLELKFKLRLKARENRIPVLMITNVGNNVLLDVERFDLEPRRAILHGLLRDIDPDALGKMNYAKWLEIANQIVGKKYFTEPMERTISKVGKKIAAVPQLGSTALMAGSLLTLFLRNIANKYPVKSGRYFFNFEEKLN